jgi:nucleotide-binding universal stress UspA family protein
MRGAADGTTLLLRHAKGVAMGPGYRRVACCIESSPASDAVVAEAVRLVADGGVLTLVHVVHTPVAVMAVPVPDLGSVRDDADRWMAERAERLRAALAERGTDAEVRTAILDGHAGVAVCEWAGRAEADLIVAASHRGLFDRALLGSFAAYVAYHAPCAVHLARPGAGAGAAEAAAAGAARA